jgi:hypothetical protein
MMKLGLILECTNDGPDKSVYEYVAQQLCESIELETVTLGNKRNLEEQAGLTASSLIEDGCEAVAIIWDQMPAWGGKKCLKTDRERIFASLSAAQVDLEKVKLIGMDEMLESWLIADGRGVTDYFQSLTSHRLEPFKDRKRMAAQRKPKEQITKYNNRYNDFTDNIKIVKYLPNFDRAARYNPPFKRFKDYVEACCAQP